MSWALEMLKQKLLSVGVLLGFLLKIKEEGKKKTGMERGKLIKVL